MHISQFLAEAKRLVESVREISTADYDHFSSMLLYDAESNTYPYVVILLMMRFGFSESIKSYCSNHQKQEIKDFGKLYQVYLDSFSSTLKVQDANHML